MTAIDADAHGYGVAIQPDGKIVLAGYTAGLNGANGFLLLRYNANGTLDPTFGGRGTGYGLTDFGGRNDRATSIIRNYNGDRLIVAGSSDGNFALARFMNNGTLDTAFQSGGKVITPYTSGPFPRLAPGPGRRFTAAGSANFHAVRYLDEGANLVAIGSLDMNGGSESGPENANFFVGRTEPLPTPLRVYLDVGATATAPFFLAARITPPTASRSRRSSAAPTWTSRPARRWSASRSRRWTTGSSRGTRRRSFRSPPTRRTTSARRRA
jgi:uncharacterized delta-60 repeat protein